MLNWLLTGIRYYMYVNVAALLAKYYLLRVMKFERTFLETG